MEIQAKLNTNGELVATFPEGISNDQLSRADLTIRYCEHIKVWIPGEAFWMTKERKDHTFYYGVVDNHLIHTLDDYAWCKFGANVKWNIHWDKLYPWDREKDPIFDDDSDDDSNDSDDDKQVERSTHMNRIEKELAQLVHLIERWNRRANDSPLYKDDYERMKWMEVEHLHELLNGINPKKQLNDIKSN